MAFEAGYDKGITFQLTGANSATTLEVKTWSVEESVDTLDTSHTNSGGIQCMIRGLKRATVNVTAVMDGAVQPTDTAPGIKAGVTGVVTADTGDTNTLSVPVLVSKLRWQSDVAGLLQWNFDAVLDGETGTYTYPS